LLEITYPLTAPELRGEAWVANGLREMMASSSSPRGA